MRRDIELAGFVITRDEWDRLDLRQRAQLVRVGTMRGEPWVPMAVVPEATPRVARGTAPPAEAPADDAYDAYEVVLAPT
jgi:hypothetical protein